MKKKAIVMLSAIIMTAFVACGQSTEEVVNPQIEAVESTDEVEADEEETEKVEETDGEKSEETIVEEATIEDDAVVEDEDVGEEVEPVETEAPKTDTGGSTNSGTPSGSTNSGTPSGSTNSGTSSGSTNSGASSGSTTDRPADPTPTPAPAPTPTPAHTHNWKEHTVTNQVWVPNIVVVDDYEYRVVGRTDDVAICNCGFTTTSRDTIVDHIKNHGYAGENTQFTIHAGYDIIEEVKVGSHEEDKGHYETQTYVDYYICEGCGETKN